jgi:hypothetical protein
MIQEITPQVVTSSLVLIILLAPVLTLVLSALLLWRYRRAVLRAMNVSGEFRRPAKNQPSLIPASAERAGVVGRRESADDARRALTAPSRDAIRHAVAGLAFALVFAVAARFVYPLRLDAPGFAIAVWIYMWPVILALPLIVPLHVRGWLSCVLAYALVFTLLGVWAGSTPDLPGYTWGAVTVAPRSSATPWVLLRLWLVVNAVPTVLMWLCFNRRVRAVGPLVLALVTTAISGTWIAILAMFSGRGADATVALSTSLRLHVNWLIVIVMLVAFTAFAAAGWALARWIARAYRARRVSDQSLQLDALWLLFASWYAMWLGLGGIAWTITAPVAFAAYTLALWVARRIGNRSSHSNRSLTFLRVFSLGTRTDALFDGVAKYWRHIGSIQVITGPDVALTTVQPHQFLDYISGKLATHFVRDEDSLERSLTQRDRVTDPDGRFGIENFFCQADAWQAVLPRLVDEGGAVLMDLRSFSAANAGCVHELRHLVEHVPFDRFLLIVDGTTDRQFLDRTVCQAWEQTSPQSPNHRRSPENAPMYRLESARVEFRPLVQRLCEAPGVPVAVAPA